MAYYISRRFPSIPPKRSRQRSPVAENTLPKPFVKSHLWFKLGHHTPQPSVGVEVPWLALREPRRLGKMAAKNVVRDDTESDHVDETV